jgi:hypothetical protein
MIDVLYSEAKQLEDMVQTFRSNCTSHGFDSNNHNLHASVVRLGAEVAKFNALLQGYHDMRKLTST